MPVSLLDELRTKYEVARESALPRSDVESFQAIAKVNITRNFRA